MTVNRTRILAATILAAALTTTLAGVALHAEHAGKKPKKDRRVQLEVLLTSATSGDPIRYASVYIRFKKKRRLRRDEKRQYVGKTDPDGLVTFPRIPTGRALIQVVAEGWRTYGKFHELESGKFTLEIALERPPKWF